MKKNICLLFTFHFSLFTFHCISQGTWTQKTDFGGTARFKAVAFAIGSKGYVGTGAEGNGSWGNTRHKDFWEYNPSTDSWTQKADFGGIARAEAVGFSIGTKGYIGTGYSSSTVYNDFWEYAPDSNKWTRKADFGGDARADAVGFSIGNKGYIGTGSGYSVNNDFWEYNPALDKWTQKADFPYGIYEAVGFSIPQNGKGYIGTGTLGSPPYKSFFYEYDPALDKWTQKANFGGGERRAAVGFAIGGEGYIGSGVSSSITHYKDLWAYDPSMDKWIQKADFGGMTRVGAVGFSIGSKGYVGTGADSYFANHSYSKDLWEFNLCSFTTSISKDTALCQGQQLQLAAGGGKYYKWMKGKDTASIGKTATVTVKPDSTTIYSVAISDDSCTLIRSVKVIVNSLSTAQVTGTTSVCTGSSTVLTASGGTTYLWNNGATTASVTVKPVKDTVCYVKIGNSCSDTTVYTTVKLFSPSAIKITGDTLICKGNYSTLTAAGGTSYLWNTGETTASITVNPVQDTYYKAVITNGNCKDSTGIMVKVTTLTAVSAGTDTTICKGNSIQLKGSGGKTGAIYRWTPPAGLNDTSTAQPWFSDTVSRTYIITVSEGTCKKQDTVVVTVISLSAADISGNTTVCSGESTVLTAGGGTTYLWNNAGETTASITVKPVKDTSYSVKIGNGCADTTLAIPVKIFNTSSVKISGDTLVCTGVNIKLTASGGTTYQWNTGDTTKNIWITPVQDTSFKVVVTNGNCKDSAVLSIKTTIPPSVNAGKDTTICKGSNVKLNGTVGTNNYLSLLQWTPSTELDKDSILQPTASPSVTTTYILNVAKGACTSTDTVTITVHPLPDVTATAADTTLLKGNSTYLSVDTQNIKSWQWTPATGLNNTVIANPVAAPQRTTTYTITVTNQNGCISSDSITILITEPDTCGAVFVPSAFSPNGDANKMNEMFKVRIWSNCVTELHFAIYNRWGVKIYKTDDIKEATEKGWDGTYKGNMMNSGVYVYYLKIKMVGENESRTISGNISLLK